MTRLRVIGVTGLFGGLVVAAPAALAQEACTRASADPATAPTTECTSCHDSGGKPDRSGVARSRHSHPVDIDYADARASRSVEFVPREQLPPFVTLAGGRITCLTCHARTATGTEARRLGRELCLGCHTLAGSSR